MSTVDGNVAVSGELNSPVRNPPVRVASGVIAALTVVALFWGIEAINRAAAVAAGRMAVIRRENPTRISKT